MKLTLCLLLAGILMSCNSHLSSDNDNSKMELLANRTCRAIGIRKKRFALADKIRFAQDTLAHTKSKSDSVRLQKNLTLYLKQKDTLLKHSLSLADTIRHQLDSLMPYTDKVAQKRFTAKLNDLLSKKGCMVTANQ
jgi:hypothetical protein